MTEPEPILTVHTGNRLETLAISLAELISQPIQRDAPIYYALEPDIVVVQSRGMARWLSLELSRENGVCANVSFPFPNAFIKWLTEIVDPGASRPESWFEPGALTWAVMDRLAKDTHLPEFGPLTLYLKEDPLGLKRYQVSRRIAWLFDQYQVFRPEMIAEWDSGGTVKDPGDEWQPVLWRSISTAGGGRHRACIREHLIRTLQVIRPPKDLLPKRVAVFGISYLPPFYIELFRALSFHLEVHFFLMNPCREFWGDIRSPRAIQKARISEPEFSMEDDLHLEIGNRLLSSMGTMGRDFFNQVADLSGEWQESFAPPQGSGILQAIQSDILFLRDSSAPPPIQFEPKAADHSLQIHSCHGPMREVQILYDNLLHMFDEDSGLRPGDVMILTPDINTYAPYVEAVFESPSENVPRIPYTIADRGVARINSSIQAFLSLLDMKKSRFTASRVADLLELDVIREKFGFSPEEYDVCRRWIRETGIRWGVNGEDRERLGLPKVEDNTWLSGIRRLLIGYALPGENRHLFMGILPFDHMEGSLSATLDRLLCLFEGLTVLIDKTARPKPPREWNTLFRWIINTFIDPGDETDEGILPLYQAMDGWIQDLEIVKYGEIDSDPDANQGIALEVVRLELEHRLTDARREVGFLSGGVTFCTMLPMRAIPFKIIGLLGMNMEAFPRKDPPAGFDIMAKEPKPGDRSARNDDKYLFLETLLSARQTLYISYVGQSVLDNSPLPPSVLVSELIDTAIEKYGKKPEDLVFRHRLQPFSPAYFGSDPGLFSYSTENRNAARVLSTPPITDAFLDARLPEPEEFWKTLGMEDLIRFFSNPAKFFLRERLGVELTAPEAQLEDREPFEVDSLSGFKLGSRWLETLRSGEGAKDFFTIHRQQGLLPHGGVGVAMVEEVQAKAEAIWDAVQPLLKAPTPAEPFVIGVDGFTLTGTTPERFQGALVAYDYGKLSAKRLLRTWFHHLACGAARVDGWSGETHLFCRDAAVRFNRAENSVEALRTLLSIYWEGLQTPAWFFPKLSHAAAKALLANEPVFNVEAKIKALCRKDTFGAEEVNDPYVTKCFGSLKSFDSTFFDIAEQVFGPMLRSIESTSL